MSEELAVKTERVDDIPLLLAQEERMGIPQLIDEHFPAHGNWQGLSPGNTSAAWLAHILSAVDHRLSHVRLWAAKCPETLSICLGQPVRELDFTDDRLALLLTDLGDDQRWTEFESSLNSRILRVYDLKAARVRVDSTTASGYWQVSEDGLFQFGHRKKHGASDQPQIKVMLSALDPLGMPVVTQVVAGNRSDDPLYIPAIRQVRASLNRSGLLYVGDSKLPAQKTRAFVQAGGDFYLGPLSKVQLPDEILQTYLEPVWSGEQPVQSVYRTRLDGETKRIAEGYEREETMHVRLGKQMVTWTERRLVIRSLGQAKAQKSSLRTRLAKAQAEVEALNEHKQGKKIYREVDAMRQKVEAILKRHKVTGLLAVQYEEREMITSPKGKPKPLIWVHIQPDEAAVRQAEARFGWHVYVTNQPKEQLSLEQAVLAYRHEYVVERSFGRLKGKPLSLTPMYLQDDQRATGLVRLLSLGLRLLTLMEFSVRQRLAQQNDTLSGVYAGNPKRATARPSAELLLEAFEHITLSVITIGQQVHRYLTPLSETQQKILRLLDLPLTIYAQLSAIPPNPP
ncbi:MAG: IS1634 family transposase [Anaerolineales bacterium]